MTRVVQSAAPVVVVAILLASPFEEGGRGSTSLLCVQLLAVALGLLWCLGRWRGELDGRRVDAIELFAIATVLAGFLSFLGSMGPAFSSLLVLTDRCVYLLLFLIFRRHGWRQLEVRTVCLVPIFLGSLLSMTSIWIAVQRWKRPAWPFVSPNQLGLYLAVVAVLATAIALQRRNGYGIWLIRVAALLCLGGLLATASRGAALGWVVGVAFIGALRYRAKWRVWLPLGAMGLLVIGAVFVSRSQRGDDPYRYDRLRIWSAASSVVADHLWVGTGPGQLEHTSALYQFPREAAASPARHSRRWSSAHSIYLQILAEQGIVGAAVFALLLLCMLRQILRRRATGPLPKELWVPVAATLLCVGCFDDWGQVPGVVWLGVVLTALASGRTVDDPAGTGDRWRTGSSFLAACMLVWGAASVAIPPYVAERKLIAPDQDGISHLREAVAWNPIHPGYQEALCSKLRDRSGDFDTLAYADARLCWERLERLAPEESDVHRGVARLEMRGAQLQPALPGSDERAMNAYAAAIDRMPVDPFLKLEAAGAAIVLGRRSEAYRWVEAALAIEPLFLRAHLEKIKLYGAAGQLAEARRALTQLEAAMAMCAKRRKANEYERHLCQLPEASLARVRSALRQEGE